MMEGEEFAVRKLNLVIWPGPVWPVPSRPTCGFLGQDPICRPAGIVDCTV